MVCSKCEKKLAKIAAPDTWKDGARNTLGGKDGGRALNENKALGAHRRFMPYASKCGVCRQSLHQQGLFCQTCAYAKGVCSMCGVQVLDTTYYKQSGGGTGDAVAKRLAAAAALAADAEEPAAAAEEAQPAPALDKLATRVQQRTVASGAHTSAALAREGGALGASAAPFLLQRSWRGPKPGYFFGTGEQGTGYYADPVQRREASAHAAAALLAPAQPAAAPCSAAAAAAEMATAAVPARTDPAALAALALQRGTLVGGALSSALGAAGRPLARPEEGGGPPPGWTYDPGSGYYADAVTQQYFDPRSRLFYDCVAQVWAAAARGLPEAGKKVRQVDRWGL